MAVVRVHPDAPHQEIEGMGNIDNSQLTRIEKMLRNILRSDGHIHRISGYVYGRTSNDDPYVILYPHGDMLEHKAVRVYKESLQWLPDFIDVNDIHDDAGGGNPDKSKAQKKGIYHECPLFEVLTYDGKDTQMGKEKRFSSVLQVLPRRTSPPPQATLRESGVPQRTPQAAAPLTPPPTTPTPPVAERVTPPTPPPAPAQFPGKGGSEDHVAYWTKEVRASTTKLMFTTAIQKLFPDKTINNVEAVCRIYMPDVATGADFAEAQLAAANKSGRLANAVIGYLNARASGMEHGVAKFAGLVSAAATKE